MAQEPTVTWLTQEAHDRLTQELEELSGPRRTEVVERIAQAREEGDLKENGGYHAAKEEQGKIEARIRTLSHLLRTAQVGQGSTSTDTVSPGSVITATIAGSESRFLLGSREIAGDDDLDVYSDHSPLGAAIVGAKVGDTVGYTAPNGRAIEVRIVKVEPFGV